MVVLDRVIPGEPFYAWNNDETLTAVLKNNLPSAEQAQKYTVK